MSEMIAPRLQRHAAGLFLGFAIALGGCVTPATSQPTLSVTELHTQAEAGDVDAMYELGVMYANGGAVPFDEYEAEKWLRKAARRGHHSAEFRLRLLLNSRGESRRGFQSVL